MALLKLLLNGLSIVKIQENLVQPVGQRTISPDAKIGGVILAAVDLFLPFYMAVDEENLTMVYVLANLTTTK
jgi:hypothetical protein